MISCFVVVRNWYHIRGSNFIFWCLYNFPIIYLINYPLKNYYHRHIFLIIVHVWELLFSHNVFYLLKIASFWSFSLTIRLPNFATLLVWTELKRISNFVLLLSFFFPCSSASELNVYLYCSFSSFF